MAKYLIEVEVNEDKLRRYNDIDVGEENEYEQSVDSLIMQEMGWTEESGIYVTSVKEVESDVTGKYQVPKDVWEFVSQYYPDYYHSNEIAQEGDLHKLVEKDYEEGDCADKLLKDEYGGDIDNPQIFTDWEAANRDILEKAIEGYIESLKGKSENG
jgi:hypothetical protein